MKDSAETTESGGIPPLEAGKATSAAVWRSPSASLRSGVTFLCERLSLAVVAIGTILMLLVFVVVEDNATHIGYYPIVFERNSDQVEVESGASLGNALQSGDRVDLQALTQQQRFALLNGGPSASTVTVRALHNGRSYPVLVTASDIDNSPRAKLARDVGTPLCFFLSLALAAALFLLRPRPITLAFYVYTMLMLVKVNQTALDLASWPINLASDLAIQVVYRFGAAHDPRLRSSALRSPESRVAMVFWVRHRALDRRLCCVDGPDRLDGLSALRDTGADDALREHLRRSAACRRALHVSLHRVRRDRDSPRPRQLGRCRHRARADSRSYLGDNQRTEHARWQYLDALARRAALDRYARPWFGLIGSIFVVYGFLSERVIDFRFAIGRAAIYGAVTAVLLLMFGILEWWAEQIFESTRPAIYVSLFAALLIGFTLNALHGRVESFLNTFFYHDQRRAEEALRHAARALANTSSERTLVEFLVDEPVRVLGLTSAALFLAQPEGGVFRRTADRGWSRQEAEQIDPEDPLIVELRAELAPLALDGRPRAETILPGGSKAPSLVVPLLMRGAVFGFVFYGPRGNGTPLTADERSLLDAIARNAGAAYDHIDADKCRERIRTLETQLRGLGVSF